MALLRSVYSFRDLNTYLNHVYSFQKKTVKGFSLARLASQLGLNSAAHTKLVLNGKRKLSVDSIYVLARALDLNLSEVEFLQILLLHSMATSEDARLQLSKCVSKIRSRSGEKAVSRSRSRLLISAPWVPVALLCLHNSAPTETLADEIAKKLMVERHALRKLIASFQSEGVLKVVNDRYVVDFQHLVIQSSLANQSKEKTFLSYYANKGMQEIAENRAEQGSLITHEPGRFFGPASLSGIPRYVC